jgi:hypothetical protein
MRCIFCKSPSATSKAVEHIIPESLGNTTQILPPGIVCDSCNNYFAGKVEKPFLEHSAISLLRFNQGVPSKRGRIPPADGVLAPGHPVRLWKHVKGPFKGSVDLPPEAFSQVLNSSEGVIVFPAEAPSPDGPLVSRFLAKVAVEAIAQRLCSVPHGQQYLVDEQQFDAIRDHARRGTPTTWPFHVRRIYEADRRWMDASGDSVQLVHEYDILITDANEWYFVLALFGLEFAINIGGPDIDLYVRWLDQHGGVSPLYWGKNSSATGLE